MEQSNYFQYLDVSQLYEWGKPQEMCEKESHALKYVSNEYKAKEMYEKVVETSPYLLISVSSHFNAKDMWTEAVASVMVLWYLFLIGFSHLNRLTTLIRVTAFNTDYQSYKSYYH